MLLMAALLPVSAQADDPAYYQPTPYVQLKHPEWAENAIIYQINTRQFTEEGTFRAAETQLPRLRELGIDIVWLMPVHPIGEKNRKGGLGSPYSIKDYFGVNPEFGTFDDLKHFVDTAHDLGMYVILDWVANHTSWDNPMHEEHPDWYYKDYKGDNTPTPWYDWDDVIDLNFDNPELRRYMASAMKFWVEKAGVDGYRCDAAGMVPLDFWDGVRAELDSIKPVFMLAEWEGRDFHAKAFDATYAWQWYERMHKIAQGHGNVWLLRTYYAWNTGYYPSDAYRLLYVANHDSNAWEGTMFESFGDALEPTIVLSVISEGMPMIYNGQEAGNNKRLKFFDKDPIQWQEHWVGDLYRKLFALKKQNSALHTGISGGKMLLVPNTNESQVFSFIRANAQDKIFAVFNLADHPHTVTFKEKLYPGTYTDFTTGEKVKIKAGQEMKLEPWEYRVYLGKP